MNDNKLFEAVGLIDDKYVEEAERHGFESGRRRKRFIKSLSSAVGFCVVTPFVSGSAPRFIKNLACAVGFCIVAAIVSYALPRAFMRTSAQIGKESVLPAATAEPSVTEPAVLPTEEADAKIVWNEGYVTAHATKGGLPTSSYASASDSFEFYGGAALPEKIDGDCTLQEEPTCVLVSSGEDGALYSSTYSYCAGAEQVIFVAYYYSSELQLQPTATNENWCFSSSINPSFTFLQNYQDFSISRTLFLSYFPFVQRDRVDFSPLQNFRKIKKMGSRAERLQRCPKKRYFVCSNLQLASVNIQETKFTKLFV